MKKILIVIFIFFCTTSSLQAKHLYTEREYQDAWCIEGKKEVVLDTEDGGKVRCDCISNRGAEQVFAIEIDFASKWYEGLAQALFYSSLTGNRAGLAIIVEDEEKDRKYINRLIRTIKFKGLDVTVWKITPKVVEDFKNAR